MRMAFFFIFCLGWISTASSQSYAVGRRTISWVDASRNNRGVGAELFYPAAQAGVGVPVVDDSLKFPVVVFGHGFLMPVSAYQWLADSLVMRGYIVALPTTEGSASPSHDQFGRDLVFVGRTIIQQNDSSSSFLLGRVHPRLAVAGHSMGGGASFLAAAQSTEVHALFNFAAAETNPSAKAAALQTNVPSLVLSGSGDCIVRDTNQLRMYNNIPYACKTYINLTQVLHCQFGNNDFTCTLGQISSFCNSTPVSLSSVYARCTQLIVPFLDYYLKSSCTSLSVFEDAYTNLSGVTTRLRSCSTDPFACDLSTRLRFYIFNGSGDWDQPQNWLQQRIPPPSLPAGGEILIQSAAGGQAVLSRLQVIGPQARLLVLSGKQLLITGSLRQE